MVQAVSFFDVVLWLHILAFFIAFGPTYAYGVFLANAAKAGPAAMVQTARSIVTWDLKAGTAGAVVLLITGLYMVGDSGFEFSDFFVSWGFIAIILILGLNHGFLIPKGRRAIELLENGQEDEAQAIGQQLGKVGAGLGVVVILTIYVMTAKPFL